MENQNKEASPPLAKELQKVNPEQKKERKQQRKRAKLRIGIISSKPYREDLIDYNEIFIKVNNTFKQDVCLVIFGYDGRNDMPELMDGVVYEYARQVSIVHYFKQLKELDLDCVLIPLINNVYNSTSENYNKYLECAILNIPVIAPDMMPYYNVIQNSFNGVLFKDKSEVIEIIKYLLSNPHMIKVMGKNANEDVEKNFNFNEHNVDDMAKMYSHPDFERPIYEE